MFLKRVEQTRDDKRWDGRSEQVCLFVLNHTSVSNITRFNDQITLPNNIGGVNDKEDFCHKPNWISQCHCLNNQT